jgi:hypothetical protein
MIFIEEGLPILVIVQTSANEDGEYRDLTTGFEKYFQAGRRYALLSTKRTGIPPMSTKLRRRIADWANSPRVRTFTKELCVGAASLVDDALSRGALAALLWFWTPPSPLKAVATDADGLDYCLRRLRAERIALPRGEAEIKSELLGLLQSGSEGPALRSGTGAL